MKTRLMIFLLSISFVTNLTAQEKSMLAVDFGERVIQDYLSYYDTLQKTYLNQNHYPDTHFWFEDFDTRQMVACFLNTNADSLTNDTIFFIIEKGTVIRDSYLNVISGDTVFELQTHCLDGGYQSFKAYKTPFLNAFSKTYWADLCEWNTTHISQPSEVVTCGGVHSYIVRLIYRSGQLISVEFCHHASKAEYDVEWYQPELEINLPYPVDKQ